MVKNSIDIRRQTKKRIRRREDSARRHLKQRFYIHQRTTKNEDVIITTNRAKQRVSSSSSTDGRLDDVNQDGQKSRVKSIDHVSTWSRRSTPPLHRPNNAALIVTSLTSSLFRRLYPLHVPNSRRSQPCDASRNLPPGGRRTRKSCPPPTSVAQICVQPMIMLRGQTRWFAAEEGSRSSGMTARRSRGVFLVRAHVFLQNLLRTSLNLGARKSKY